MASVVRVEAWMRTMHAQMNGAHPKAPMLVDPDPREAAEPGPTQEQVRAKTSGSLCENCFYLLPLTVLHVHIYIGLGLTC